MKYKDKLSFENKNFFGIGKDNEANKKFFNKNTWVNYLGTSSDKKLSIFNVNFEPGCRTHWHMHKSKKGGDQFLICTAGEGWYQERGKEVIELKEGKVIIVPPNTEHWHGAKKDSYFSHITFFNPDDDLQNIIIEELDDEFYNNLKD